MRVVTLGRRVRQARKRRSLTQTELAKAADTTQDTISSMERGKHMRIDLRLLDRIADALEVEFGWLLS